MDKSYTTARCEATDSYEEKKSVFYGFIKPIEEEAEALEFIEKIRRDMPNMRHVCYAYVNRVGNVVRFSDDHEPQGTAGMPILEVIRREGLTGVVIAVARYFGGVLLGAGGLTRAYGKAAKLALDKAGKATFVLYSEVEITADYSAFQKLSYEISKMGLDAYDIKYEAEISCRVLVNESEFETITSKVLDVTAGRGKIKTVGEKYAPER